MGAVQLAIVISVVWLVALAVVAGLLLREKGHQRSVQAALDAERQRSAAAQQAFTTLQDQLRQAVEEDAARRRDLEAELAAAKQAITAVHDRYRGIADADAERRRVLDGIEAERTRMLGAVATDRTRAEAEFEQTKGAWNASLRALHEQYQRTDQELQARGQAEVVRLEAERAKAQAEFAENQAGWRRALFALQGQHKGAEAELGNLRAAIEKELVALTKVRAEMKTLDEEANLQAFAFYKPQYAFSSVQRFQAKLDEIRERQKLMLKDKRAAIGQIAWTVNGSEAEGRKQINQTLKLMLRAFNGECDAAIAKVKYNNVVVMEERLQKAREAINALAAVQQCIIVPEYMWLKLEELRLVHEYQEKQQADREEQRRIKEQMREEEAALREIEKARQDAEREEKRYADALTKAREEVERAVGAKQDKLRGQIEELEQRLAQAQQNIRAVAQAQLTRSGHVYVISNIGSFGEHVYKIGMTRRLDPLERVDELGSASVPFDFDVHAMIRATDAPALETALHRQFHDRRVNLVNQRKEFFRVTIQEIASAVAKLHGEIDMIPVPEAEEYRKTVAMASSGQMMPPSGAQAETPAPAAVTA